MMETLTTFIVVVILQYIDVYQIIMLSTFCLHNVTRQSYFNKFRKNRK